MNMKLINTLRASRNATLKTSFKLALFTLVVVTLLNACGEEELEDDLAEDSKSSSVDVGADESSGAEKKFAGYVVNAFEVVVDGAPYRDLETFYGEELKRLPGKLEAAGYSPFKSVKFEAEIGFKDLFRNMDVYITAEGDRGYQGSTMVLPDGKFEIAFPQSIVGDTFKVRANKRISVVVEKEEGTEKFCYNFSAAERNIQKSEADKPIILSEFETRITQYACPQVTSGGGITVPEQSGIGTSASQVSGLLRPGISKQEVLNILGQKNLIIESTNKWCWQVDYRTEDVCAVSFATVCACYVTFSEGGGLESQNNIVPEKLDVLAW
jgi:hypothetical protein